MRKALCLAACALACSRDLGVPPQVAAPVVVIDSFSPAHAFAGSRVTVSGKHLGQSTAEALVRVGSSKPFAPVSVDPQGASLVFEVPDDAAAGPLVVTAPLGQAQSAANFTFDGVGRLKVGRVSATRDLSVRIGAALPLAGADFAFLETRYGRVVSYTRATATAKQTIQKSPLAITSDVLGTLLFVLDHDRTDAACPGGAGHLTRIPQHGVNKSFCLPAGTGTFSASDFGALAIDQPPTHALAVIGSSAWLVDLGASTAGPAPLALDTPIAPLAAWMGGTLFVTADAGGLRQVDWSQAAPLQDAAAIDAGFPASLAVKPAFKELLVGDVTGSLFRYDVTAWPPTLKDQPLSFASANGWPTSMTYTPDGTRLAVGNDVDDKLIIYDTSGALVAALQEIPLPKPEGIVAAGGLFFVGVTAGVALVSQESGALLETVPLTGLLSAPRLRQAPAGISGNHSPYFVELGSKLFSSTQFVPSNMTDVVALFQPQLDTPALFEVSASAAGTAVYTRHVNEVRSVATDSSGHETEDPTNRVTFAIGTGSAVSPRMLLADDSSALLYVYAHGNGRTLAPDRVVLLDTSKPLTQASPGTIDDANLRRAFLAGGRVALFDQAFTTINPASVQLYDQAALRSGQVVPKGSVALDTTPDRVGVALGKLFTVIRHPAGYRLHVIDPAGPTIVDGDRITGWEAAAVQAFDQGLNRYVDDFAVSQSGTRLYRLAGAGEQRHLQVLVIQPDTAAVRGEEPPIPLPAGAADVLLHPDGEHLFVLDAQADQLLLLE